MLWERVPRKGEESIPNEAIVSLPGSRKVARILIAHALFETIGGGEYLALNMAKALAEAGHSVTIVTYSSFNRERIEEILGVKLDNIRVVVEESKILEKLREISKGRMVRLKRLVAYKDFLSKLRGKYNDYDVIIDTQSNVPTPVDITYIHYPILLPHTTSKSSKGKLYDTIVRLYVRKVMGRPGRVLANSKWTAAKVYKAYHIIPDILYPPVDVEYFSRAAKNAEREKIILTITRFTPEKNLEEILKIAKQLTSYKFILVGSTGPESKPVLQKLQQTIKENNLENVELRPNLPKEKLVELMKRAKYYLHPPFPEHFGIAVVEAMAAGLVPIVYRDGGAWHDMVSIIHSRLGYNGISEVTDIIRWLESKPEAYNKLRVKGMVISKTFNYENFKKDILKQINYIASIKRLVLL